MSVGAAGTQHGGSEHALLGAPKPTVNIATTTSRNLFMDNPLVKSISRIINPNPEWLLNTHFSAV